MEVDGEHDELELATFKMSQRYYAMQYRTSYLLWKMQWAWPFFEYVSIWFNYGLCFFILCCALYYSIAVIWLVWLIIFMMQSWKTQRVHMNYQKEQVSRFKDLSIEFEDGGDRTILSSNEKRLYKLQDRFLTK